MGQNKAVYTAMIAKEGMPVGNDPHTIWSHTAIAKAAYENGWELKSDKDGRIQAWAKVERGSKMVDKHGGVSMSSADALEPTKKEDA